MNITRFLEQLLLCARILLLLAECGEKIANVVLLVTKENVHKVATPRVLSASHNNWFILSIGANVHVFDLTLGMEQMNKYHFVPEEDCDFEVIAVQFLPDCDVFVLVLSNGAVHMVTPFYGKNAMKPQWTAGNSKTTDKQKELKGLTVQPIRQQPIRRQDTPNSSQTIDPDDAIFTRFGG